MMSDTLSPEERLLKVIQQGKLTAGQDRSGGKEKAGGWFERFKRPQAAQSSGKLGADLKEILARMKWPELEPEKINKVLAVILVGVLAFAAYPALRKQRDVSVIAAASKAKISSAEDKKKIQPLKGLSFYLSGLRKRDIFRASAAAPAVDRVEKQSETLTKTAENLKLQGISWGDVPKVMINWQNGKDSKMYFLVEGQAIGTTGFKVTKISKTVVKIGDGREEMVLL